MTRKQSESEPKPVLVKYKVNMISNDQGPHNQNPESFLPHQCKERKQEDSYLA